LNRMLQHPAQLVERFTFSCYCVSVTKHYRLRFYWLYLCGHHAIPLMQQMQL